MKSAIELAMEKAGGKGQKLTDSQKKEIAEIRSKAKAKIAEEEIMFAGKIPQLPPGADGAASEEIQIVKEQLAKIIYKINDKMESDIEKVRNKKP